jgi:hypothetical protein
MYFVSSAPVVTTGVANLTLRHCVGPIHRRCYNVICERSNRRQIAQSKRRQVRIDEVAKIIATSSRTPSGPNHSGGRVIGQLVLIDSARRSRPNRSALGT